MKATSLQFEMADGVVIAADAWGDPSDPPVLLSHGGGQTRHAWGDTARAVAEQGWYAVAYDHRGHGDSDWSPDGEYGFHAFAEDQKTIARALSRPPVVVGASLGGVSAMLAEGESLESVYSAVILVDITPRMDVGGAENIVGFMREHVDEGFADLEEAADVIARYTGRPRRTDISGLRKNLRRGKDGRYYWHWDPKFLNQRGDMSSMPERLVTAARSIGQPILLIRGQKSELVTEELAQEFLELLPHAEYVDVEHARHMVAGDRNDIFTHAVVEFLADLKAA